jgi:amino acid adenylation domain-containing protein
MVVGVVGILKAGGGYVPLDATYPKGRLAYMIEDSGLGVILTEGRLEGRLPENGAEVVRVDSESKEIGEESEEKVSRVAEEGNLAYVIYTSGSTGKPKGVQVPHYAVTNFLISMQQQPGLKQEDVLAAVTTLSFDIAALEMFLPLSVGARLVVMSREAASDAAELMRRIDEESATAMQATPATWRMLIEAGWEGKADLKIICGGEALSRELAEELAERSSELWNMYGPTETTIWSAAYKVRRGEAMSIGKPIANTSVYILGRHLNPVPVGVAGEMYIAGDGVARGYLNQPGMTSERFIPDPFSDQAGVRLYRTGDLARYRAGGEIEFLGRIDDQVKVRGYRIELGEIEAAIAQHQSVRECAAVAREDEIGEKRLIAYLVAAGEEGISAAEMRSYLKEKLPEYMIPQSFVTLKQMPLTPNGKVDRARLPKPDHLRPDTREAFEAPRTPVEEALASIWASVLKVERVGIHDNFFELGGHSLLATRVISHVSDALQVRLPLRTIFESPTVVGLAALVEIIRRTEQGLQPPPLRPVSREGDLPLSFAQQRLWFLDYLERSHSYNISHAVRIKGVLNIKALKRTLNTVLSRHESLRTTFVMKEGQTVQVISPESSLNLIVIDLGDLPQARREAEALSLADREAKRPFDLARGPLFRASLLRLTDQEHILSLGMHHIISDGWSIGVLYRELGVLYEAFTRGKPSPLEPLPIQYADYAVWQKQWLQDDLLDRQLGYWKQQLDGSPAVLELPTDRPRPPMQSFRGARQSLTLSKSLSQQLKQLSQQQGVTLFMTLLGAFQLLLSRYSGQDDVVVGSPIANRNRTEMEDMIGFFVNTLVLRTDLSGDPTFKELLGRVKEVALGAYAHQDLPFERLVEELKPERDLSRNPLVQVLFALQNVNRSALKLKDLILEPLGIHTGTTKFDLSLFVTESSDALTASVEFDTDLFLHSTINRFLAHFITLLDSIVSFPDRRISQLPILTHSELHQILRQWNDTSADYPHHLCLHHLFEAQVDKTPHAVAVVSADDRLSYLELNRRANRLAHYLIRSGVGPESLVAISGERDTSLLVGLLGILKSGAAYLPLDPAYPKERLAFMLEDSDVRLILTGGLAAESLRQQAARVVSLEADWDEISRHCEDNPGVAVCPNNLAYVIYTSGSTGRAKGVAIEHASVVTFLHWAREVFTAEEMGGMLASTSICFDLSVFEMFAPLSCGGKVILAENALHLPTLGAREEVRLINTVPSAMTELVRAGAVPESVRTVALAGEALQGRLVEEVYGFGHIGRVMNLYGPSEDTTYSTYAVMRRGDGLSPAIGRPIANTQAYILDVEMRPVPVGVAGELCLGGEGLARGYLNRAEMTAERFIPDEYGGEEGGRLYRTGDVVRWREDGEIEYVGRMDHQVKVRGYRIELGEIEAMLRRHELVRESVVIVREDVAGDRRIVAYVVESGVSDEEDQSQGEQAKEEQVGQWQMLYDQIYAKAGGGVDARFNTAGWNSSYTGQAIAAEHMKEWVDRTVERILELKPERVMEIGCGTGMLLMRMAGRCAHYYGTDLSGVAIGQLREQIGMSEGELGEVKVEQREADDYEGIEEGSYDCVVLNSVVQYFPSMSYLVKVLEGAARVTRAGGHIFVGDVRRLGLLEAFHTSVELSRAGNTTRKEELRERVRRRVRQEKELVIDEEFFRAVGEQIGRIRGVEVELKRGRYENEVSKFRYDVVMEVGEEEEGGEVGRGAREEKVVEWGGEGMRLERLREELGKLDAEEVRIKGIVNARVEREVMAVRAMESAEGAKTAGEIRREVEREGVGIEPEEIREVGEEEGYRVEIGWSIEGGAECYDVVMRREGRRGDVVAGDGAGRDRERKEEGKRRGEEARRARGWREYGNEGKREEGRRRVGEELRRYVREKVPEYMVPSVIVVIEEMPRTANGKVDRRRLPEVEQRRREAGSEYEGWRTPVEREMVKVFGELIGVEGVGIHDNFFEMGGHSLLATQVVSRVRDRFNVELPLRSLFEHPTVAGLAVAIAQSQAKGEEQEEMAHVLAELNELTEEEAERLLAAEIQDEPDEEARASSQTTRELRRIE